MTHRLFTCHLTKLETAFEQIRKGYPKLRPTDAATLASALVLTGRHATAVYEGEHFAWPEDYERLAKSLVVQIEQIQLGSEPVKKTSKTAVEEEPVHVTVGLIPNYTAGERVLSNRKDLKAALSDILAEGVEFVYSSTDVGWQWALDRANWSTVSGGELIRRVKVKANFSEGAVGVEMGSSTKKRPSRAKAAPVEAAEPAEVSED